MIEFLHSSPLSKVIILEARVGHWLVNGNFPSEQLEFKENNVYVDLSPWDPDGTLTAAIYIELLPVSRQANSPYKRTGNRLIELWALALSNAPEMEAMRAMAALRMTGKKNPHP